MLSLSEHSVIGATARAFKLNCLAGKTPNHFQLSGRHPWHSIYIKALTRYINNMFTITGLNYTKSHIAQTVCFQLGSNEGCHSELNSDGDTDDGLGSKHMIFLLCYYLCLSLSITKSRQCWLLT